MKTRKYILRGTLFVPLVLHAPAIVKAENIMKIVPSPVPPWDEGIWTPFMAFGSGIELLEDKP